MMREIIIIMVFLFEMYRVYRMMREIIIISCFLLRWYRVYRMMRDYYYYVFCLRCLGVYRME